ncbi:MAG: hypothetical protein HQK50_10355 [Oligoflexia bacterium]|nr:hypothetical protein [Oligoflexia bacterium]MBF0365963.1 hypothetical protein [Oligoflexia bacterium]
MGIMEIIEIVGIVALCALLHYHTLFNLGIYKKLFSLMLLLRLLLLQEPLYAADGIRDAVVGAEVVMEKALIYADDTLSAPIGYVLKKRKLLVKILHKNDRAVLVTIKGQDKVAYMNREDLAFDIDPSKQQEEIKGDSHQELMLKEGNIELLDELDVVPVEADVVKRRPMIDEEMEAKKIEKRTWGAAYRLFSLSGVKETLSDAKSSNRGSLYSFYHEMWPRRDEESARKYGVSLGAFYLKDAHEELTAIGAISSLKTGIRKVGRGNLMGAVSLLYSPLLQLYSHSEKNAYRGSIFGYELNFFMEWELRRTFLIDLGAGFLHLISSSLTSKHEDGTSSKVDFSNKAVSFYIGAGISY